MSEIEAALRNATLLAEAYEAGEAYADAIKPGDDFLGARPAAESAYDDESARRMFVQGAIDRMHETGLDVWTEHNTGRVTRVERRA